VLPLLATGLSSPAIADDLCIAASTARSYGTNSYAKRNVHKRCAAVQGGHELQRIQKLRLPDDSLRSRPRQPRGGLLLSPRGSPRWGMTTPPRLGYTSLVL
jgi:hypothetical protein